MPGFSGDTVDSNDGAGISTYVHDESEARILFDSLAITDNDAEGMFLQADGTANEHSLRVAVHDTTIDGSTTPGLLAQTVDDGRLLLELDGNRL